ncbi:helix-turn-helix domain-containing protein [Halorussus litoreus]|uniref:helix-turn-helix domain-containing protein n=1 Tax=Halorussus litoreus TaxID=1710536 RepID=UPI000E231BC4|nr:helix-turn-helix domain-containing protein [Halorussus litoreus]
MLEYTFSIEHDGCWTQSVNAVFPDVTATILHSYRLTGTSITMIEVNGVDDGTIDELVDWLADHPVMNASRLVSYDADRGRAFVSLEGDYDTDTEPVLNVLLRNNAFPTVPATVIRGRENWNVLVSSHEEVSRTHEELQELGSVDVEALRQPNTDRLLTGLTELKEAVQNLSPRQRELLSLAIEEGYYDSPRSCNIEELAELDSANMSTVGEHLRRSEAKILNGVATMLGDPEKTAEQGERS